MRASSGAQGARNGLKQAMAANLPSLCAAPDRVAGLLLMLQVACILAAACIVALSLPVPISLGLVAVCRCQMLLR
jgi:hypothetical protein